MSRELEEQLRVRAREIMTSASGKAEAERLLKEMTCELVGCSSALVEVGWWPELNDRRASILPGGDWHLGPVHIFI